MTDPMTRLLLTRPVAASDRFLGQLRAVWSGPLEPVISPLIRIVPMEVRIQDFTYQALIFTSEQGVQSAVRLGLPLGLTAYVVGPQTARAAQAAGFQPISAKGNAADLVALILDLRPSGPLLHLRGENVAGDVTRRLQQTGIPASEVVAYRQERLPLSIAARIILDGPAPVVVPLFSPITVSNLAKHVPFLGKLHVVAISDAVALAAAMLAPQRLTVAAEPNSAAMLQATVAALEGAGRAG